MFIILVEALIIEDEYQQQTVLPVLRNSAYTGQRIVERLSTVSVGFDVRTRFVDPFRNTCNNDQGSDSTR